MASPHIAGLAAYMLGTEWAEQAAKEEALALRAAAKQSTSFATKFGQIAFGQRALSGKPEDHLLSPKALKKHMIDIASKKKLTGVRDMSRLDVRTQSNADFGPICDLQDLGVGSPNVLSFNGWTAPKNGDDDSSAPSKKPEGKWRFETAVADVADETASDLMAQIKDEIAALRSEIRAEVDEVAELVKELAEELN